jgi:hypothetical protein
VELLDAHPVRRKIGRKIGRHQLGQVQQLSKRPPREVAIQPCHQQRCAARA